MSLRILIVDDNVDTAVSFTFLCESWGHETLAVHDGLAAIAAIRRFQPDAILLDIGLPKLDGFETAERIRNLPEGAKTFIVATSGYSREKDLRRAGEVGIDHYLIKPFDPWRLESILDGCRRPQAVHA